MLKFLFKIILIIILLFGFSNYANYLVTGEKPELDINEPILPDIDISKITDSISDKFESVKKEVQAQSEVKESYLYKWRDEKGVIHYTSEKPAENIRSLESIKLSNDTNVVPAVPVPQTSSAINNQQQALSTEAPTNVYSPEGIKHLFDQAKSIQNLMNEQFTQQENIINNE